MIMIIRTTTACILLCLLSAVTCGWNPFSKNGLFTKITEALPGGGFITAPIHAAAGNPTNALQAAVAGFGTLGALAIGGPPGAIGAGLAIGTAGLTSIIAENENRIEAKPEAVAGAVVVSAGAVGRAFEHLDGGKREEAEQAAGRGDSTKVGQSLLEAVEQIVAESTRQLSGEAGGRKQLKSAHGTYLRALEPNWKVDMAQAPAKEWEQWYIEDWGGKVVLKGRGAPDKPGQFLSAHPDGAVDLVGTHPREWEMWKPFKNDDGSWSFLSVHGTWLSADSNGSVYTVVRCQEWEHFWLEWW